MRTRSDALESSFCNSILSIVEGDGERDWRSVAVEGECSHVDREGHLGERRQCEAEEQRGEVEFCPESLVSANSNRRSVVRERVRR